MRQVLCVLSLMRPLFGLSEPWKARNKQGVVREGRDAKGSIMFRKVQLVWLTGHSTTNVIATRSPDHLVGSQ